MTEEFPLSFQQEAIVDVLGGLDDAFRSYQHVVAWEVDGPIGKTNFARGFDTLANLHPALRTRFARRGGRHTQRAVAPEPVEVQYKSATGSGGVAVAQAAIEPELERGFDLTREQLVRGVVVHLGPERHVVVLTTHHLVCDGRSLDLLEDTLARACTDDGADVRTNADRPRYLEYARHQRDEADARRERELRYWRLRLGGYVSPLRSTPDPRGEEFASHPAMDADTKLASGAITRLGEMAAARKTTTFAALTAAFAITLQAWLQRDDIVVATACANRGDPSLSRVVGHFSNTIFLRLSLAANDTFGSAMTRAGETLFDSLEHQDSPLVLVSRNSNAIGLYDFRFEVDRHPKPLTVGQLKWTRLPSSGPSTTRSLLSAAVVIEKSDASAVLLRPAALASKSHLRRAVGQFARLVNVAAEGADFPIEQLVLNAKLDRPDLAFGSSAIHAD